MAALIIAEPPVAYQNRPSLVVDASVLTAAVFAESNCDQALQWMRGRSLHAPQLVDYELANAALNKLRRKQATAEAAAEALAAFSALDIERRATALDGVFKLAAQWRLTAYDAAYLWLAAELKAPLATFDSRLGAAAKAHLGSLGSKA
ncbi:MAG: type II toxin-antitoxin system VapC family toxin [Pseudomonadota bacterium]